MSLSAGAAGAAGAVGERRARRLLKVIIWPYIGLARLD